MPQWIAVGPDDMLADGQMKEVPLEGHTMLLARVDSAYYAADGLCPHMSAHLANGTLNGLVVTCPRHGSQFDLRDGRYLKWTPDLPGIARKVGRVFKAASDLRTFATRVQDGQVWIESPQNMASRTTRGLRWSGRFQP
jgi:nitrite reductase/ring-hydroxylating ferredoxin subunit